MNVYIPAKVRGPVYAVYALLGVVAGSMTVTFDTMAAPQPTWLRVALSVYVFLGGAIGYTAASHTPAAPVEPVAAAPVVAPAPVAPADPVPQV